MSDQDTAHAIRDEIIRRAWDGATFAQIAADVGLGAHRVGQVARESGFPTRGEMARLQGDAICAFYEKHGNVAEVSRRLSLSRQTVRNTLDSRGIKKIERRNAS
ncbi:MAG: hypothetical protein OXR82_17565 [Gammaproteobacteria bacterium]|nr:hypothetical protein [Gammaproteobacteria bacterium]